MDRRQFLASSAGAAVLATQLGATQRQAPVRVAAVDEAVHRARQAALEVLKPTEAQVQHGLELHAASLVAESYGFSPRAAPDGELAFIRVFFELGIRSYLGGKGDLSSFLDHIDYAVKRFGADHVAIGTDVAYAARDSEVEMKRVPRWGTSPARWEKLWPPDVFKLPGEHPSLAWLNWPMFTVGMVQRGHKDADIQKILGGNVLRVARATLGF